MRDYAVTAVGRTHVGLQKPNNEDAFHISDSLLLVADGVGGSVAGEVASSTVVDVFAAVPTAMPGDDLYAILTTAVDRCTDSLLQRVLADPCLDGMGTTATVMMWAAAQIVFAQIGDSRAYYLQDGAPRDNWHPDHKPKLQQVTKDDSFVQYLVDQGRLTLAEAAHHPRRNVILKALNGSTVSPTLCTYAARIGDRYLLCSDGLSDYVAGEDIRAALYDTAPDPAADRLIELSLAAGAPDNVTVIIADIVETGTVETSTVETSTVEVGIVGAGIVGAGTTAVSRSAAPNSTPDGSNQWKPARIAIWRPVRCEGQTECISPGPSAKPQRT